MAKKDAPSGFDFARETEVLVDRMRRAGLADREVQIAPHLRWAIGITPRSSRKSDVSLGASRLFGVADVIDVPRAEPGAELRFVAQIAMRDVAPLDAAKLLPAEGLLSFFVVRRDEEHEAVVRYFGPETALRPAPQPSDAKPHGLDFAGEVVLPPYGSAVKPVGDSAYERFYDDWFAESHEAGRRGRSGLFGWDRCDEHVLSVDDVLLLRIDADEVSNWPFYEAVCAYFILQRDALSRRDFARTRFRLGPSI